MHACSVGIAVRVWIREWLSAEIWPICVCLSMPTRGYPVRSCLMPRLRSPPATCASSRTLSDSHSTDSSGDTQVTLVKLCDGFLRWMDLDFLLDFDGFFFSFLPFLLLKKKWTKKKHYKKSIKGKKTFGIHTAMDSRSKTTVFNLWSFFILCFLSLPEKKT